MNKVLHCRIGQHESHCLNVIRQIRESKSGKGEKCNDSEAVRLALHFYALYLSRKVKV